MGLFRAVGDRLGEANAIAAQGQMAVLGGDQEAGDHLLAQAAALYQAIGSLYSVAAQTGNCGLALLRAGEPERARPYLLQAAQLFTEMGLQDHAQQCLRAAGEAADPVESRAQIEQALPSLRQSGNRELLVQALNALQEVSRQQEDWSAVQIAAEELIALGAANADTWSALGDARSNQSDEAGAVEAYAQAVSLAGDRAMLRRNFANSLITLGRLDEAAAQLKAAEVVDPDSPFLALRWAELAKAQGDPLEAERWATEALRRQPEWDEAQQILDWVREQ